MHLQNDSPKINTENVSNFYAMKFIEMLVKLAYLPHHAELFNRAVLFKIHLTFRKDNKKCFFSEKWACKLLKNNGRNIGEIDLIGFERTDDRQVLWKFIHSCQIEFRPRAKISAHNKFRK